LTDGLIQGRIIEKHCEAQSMQREYFDKRKIQEKSIVEEKKKLLGQLMRWRLFVFVGGTALTAALLHGGHLIAGITTGILTIVLFVLVLIAFYKTKESHQKHQEYLKIYEQYLARIERDWDKLDDGGKQWIEENHPYSNDLDIFGDHSLYRWINIGQTPIGKEKLAKLLNNPYTDQDKIEKRQRIIKELADKTEFGIHLQAEGKLQKKIQYHADKLIAFGENTSNKKVSKGMHLMLAINTTIMLGSFVLASLEVIWGMIPILLFVLQIAIHTYGFNRNKKLYQDIYGSKQMLEAYKHLFDRIEKESFKGQELKELQEKLREKGSAAESIKGLARISDALDIRYNPLIYLPLNYLLQWDYHWMIHLSKWQRKYGSEIKEWLNIVGEFECFASLALISQIHDDWVYPVIDDKGQSSKMVLDVQDIGHPLIPPKVCQSNNFEMKNSYIVVTGSNMSGKTTFLRTVGINLILAYTGAPVCAVKMKCSLMKVYTSMRINDDLTAGISTFHAELLRIKMIVEAAQSGEPMIYLIDEIFRGTNSLDRIQGAKSVMLNLKKPHIMGMMSTHDFELCDLEAYDSNHILNYHFTEYYLEDKIQFDYKIRKGRSETTNARYLMGMVGIQVIEDREAGR